MAESVFASRATIGGRYVTGGGWPIEVLGINGKVEVRNLLTGGTHRVWPDQLFWPYDKKRINKEAIIMAKAEKAEGKKAETKGADRGIVSASEGKVVLFREVKGDRRELTLDSKGAHYDGKTYSSLKEAAEALAGVSISGSGKTYFGLRRPEAKAALKEVKALAAAWKAAAKKDSKAAAKKTKKARKAKAVDEDEDDDGKKPTTAGQVVAKVFGKARR